MSDLQIEGYQLSAIRGEHHMGTVYDALRLPGRREVELLVLHASLQLLPGLEQRFLNAAQRAINLGDGLPGIVPVHAAGADGAGGRQRLFLERHALAAKGLDAYLARGTALPLHVLPRTVLTIASRLEHIHRQDLVHGNLTPAALRWTTDRQLFLTDLGLPHLRVQEIASIKARANEILPYMSPEQMFGQELTEASDVFSLGVIAYYLATGRLPRQVSQLRGGLGAYWAQIPQLLHDLQPEVAPHFSAVVHKALNLTPEHRFAHAAHIVEALQELVSPAVYTTSGVETGAAPPATGGEYVPPLQNLAIEMEPREIDQGQFVTLTLRNAGHEALNVAVRAEDESGSLRFAGEHDDFVVPAGDVETVEVRVSAREQPLVGRARILPFFISVASAEDSYERLKGEVSITPAVPAWIAGIVLLALVAACSGLAFLIWSPFGSGLPSATRETTGTIEGVLAASATDDDTAATGETDLITVTVVVTQTAVPAPSATPTAVPTEPPTAVASETPTTLPTETPSAVPSETPQTTPTAEEDIAAANEIAVELEVDERREIWVVARDGSGQRLLVENGANVAWSPDGRRLVFTQPVSGGVSGAERLFVITAAGTQLRPLTGPLAQIGGLSWSAEGSQIAYHASTAESGQETEFQIFVANADGSGSRQLTTGEDGFNSMWPIWSPQGTQILVYSAALPEGTGGQLRLVTSGSAAPVTLFEDSDWDLFAGEYDWSPDGEQIVFSASEENEPSRLYVIDHEDQGPAALATGGSGARAPVWSPAGDRIVYVAGTDGGQQSAALISVEGGDERILAGGLPVNQLLWSPQGEEVGIVADFNVDGLFQLFIFAADGSGLTPLIGDPSALTGGVSGGAGIVSAQWRPLGP